jgi:uncharacterized protein DUF4398
MRATYPLLIAALACLAGCAFVPRENLRLEEAREAYAEAMANPAVAALANAQLRLAADALERATAARDTLDDPALVDHLAYIAKQRVAIGREATRQRGPGP